MNVHELTLQNYAAGGGCPSACQPMLYLGTAGSYGNEQINVVLGEGWQGLTVKAVFQPSGVPVVVPDGGGVISVPWEATQSVVAYPNGRISFQGYVSGRLVNTSDVPYTVGGSSAGSDNTPAPTPDEFQQFVDAVKSDADRAAQAAADAEAAVQKVTNAGTQAVTDIGNAKDSALEIIGVQHARQQITDDEYNELYSMATNLDANNSDDEAAIWRTQVERRLADLEESVGQLLEGSGGDEPAPDAPDGSADKPIEAYRGMTYYKDKYYLDPEDSNTYICTRDRDDAPGTGLALYYLPHELAGIYFQVTA